MKWRIQYRPIAGLPKLAWLASLDREGGGEVTVLHGSAVECRGDWMVEGVWDGEFERGEFHRSENFFGSGIRLDGDRIHFVPSSAPMDRLFYCNWKRTLLVSNSLVLLLGYTGARLDSNHDYNEDSRAILNGVKRYEKAFRVCHPEIERFCQVYHERLVVSGGGISFELTSRVHDIRSFEQYSSMLQETLVRLRHNFESPLRTVRLDAFTNLSSGYDSTAAASLVKAIGVTTCFTSQRSSSLVPRWISGEMTLDDGRPIAAALNLRALPLDPPLSKGSDDELYFYATDPGKSELVFQRMATHIAEECQAAVVFTGHFGGTVWDVNLKSDFVNDELMRNDLSGLRLSEVRLKSGFLHVPVPAILARSIVSIMAISRSPEMAPWRLGNDYDRPIPRRIAETAGVARHLFGMRKKMVSKLQRYPRDARLRRQFFEFLQRNYGLSRGAIYLRTSRESGGVPVPARLFLSGLRCAEKDPLAPAADQSEPPNQNGHLPGAARSARSALLLGRRRPTATNRRHASERPRLRGTGPGGLRARAPGRGGEGRRCPKRRLPSLACRPQRNWMTEFGAGRSSFRTLP